MPISITRRPSVRTIAGFPTNRTLQNRLEKMLAHLRKTHAEVSVLLTDDAEIMELNGHYRGKAKPTDVLSFGLSKQQALPPDFEILGDLVISATTVKRQARQAKRTMRDEATLLLAHGLLHLMGMDHRTKKEDQKMRAKADELCISAGARPFFAMGGVDEQGQPRPISEEPQRSRKQTRRTTGVLPARGRSSH